MPHASDERGVTLRFGPINSFFLSLERAKLMVRVVFHYIILNRRSFGSAFRAGFDINVCHISFSAAIVAAMAKWYGSSGFYSNSQRARGDVKLLV
jgi:hypothetical protein